MKKILVVKIIQTMEKKKKIGLVTLEINCSASDEASIKRAIESSKDPNLLITIFAQNMDKAMFSKMKPDLDGIRESIAHADSIHASFMPLGGCDKNCSTCVLHDLEEKLGKIFLHDELNLSHPCQN
jgi:hypothetical protein